MKKYIRSAKFSGDKRLDSYIEKFKKIVNLELPDSVTKAEWDMEDDTVLLNLTFTNGDEHLFTFEVWRFTMREGYISEDADIILRTVENYIRNTGIDPFATEFDNLRWELVEKKSVEDWDGFTTDYTLWYTPVEKRWVCIFGDSDLYTPETTDPDAEFETKREAYEWFDSYGEDDWMDEVESCDSIMSNESTEEMTASDIVTWMYKEFNDYEFYDERDLKDDEVRLIFEVGKKSARPYVEEALDARNIKYRFIGNRLFIDALDDYEVEYIGEACDVGASEEEFIDMGLGANYWYFTTHGVQPGSVPRGLNIIKILDTPNGTFFLTDRVLTTKSLKYYDIKERAPKDIEASIENNYYTSLVSEDVDPNVELVVSSEIKDIDFKMLKTAIDVFKEDLKKIPSGMDELDIKYDRDKGRIYNKYRPLADKCEEISKSLRPTGYGRSDYIDVKKLDLCKFIDYRFPYGWKVYVSNMR